LKLDEGQSTILFAAVLIIAIACVAVWVRLVRKFTLMKTWKAALAVLAVAFIPLYFANSLVSAVVGSALVGFGFAGVITTMDLVGARVIDEDTQKHHLRREGIISNALGFMNRLNGLFTSFAFVLVYTLFGFESGKNPGTDPANAARFLLTVFPIVVMVISFGFSFLVKFARAETAPEAPDKGLEGGA
jgi:GPH family glycoside/pentoside/hexuronide:cation symporter